jgi:stage IV sporulation protein FB
MLLLGEPPPTHGDLHFRIFGIPVRVHPFFWVVTLLLGLGGGEEADPKTVLIWVAVVFVSILVHELGHAFTQRYYRGRPWITLYSFGGLASCDDCDRSPRSQIIISFAGPVAGFLLAGIVFAAVAFGGHRIGFTILRGKDFDPLMHTLMEMYDINRIFLQPLTFFGVYFEPFHSELLNHTIAALLQVNILWGILNLLPIYPLDGGRVARELFTLRDPRYGITQSLQLSAGVAVLVAAYALLNQRLFTAVMFGMFAYGNFQTLQAYRDRWR